MALDYIKYTATAQGSDSAKHEYAPKFWAHDSQLGSRASCLKVSYIISGFGLPAGSHG